MVQRRALVTRSVAAVINSAAPVDTLDVLMDPVGGGYEIIGSGSSARTHDFCKRRKRMLDL